ncbi:MAG: hypothetical protein NTY66_01940 [Candidatus Vogelbacteria bacterium]|nr:hypothetical protein [Candidatus Vogelbacteria bacterium]
MAPKHLQNVRRTKRLAAKKCRRVQKRLMMAHKREVMYHPLD